MGAERCFGAFFCPHVSAQRPGVKPSGAFRGRNRVAPSETPCSFNRETVFRPIVQDNAAGHGWFPGVSGSFSSPDRLKPGQHTIDNPAPADFRISAIAEGRATNSRAATNKRFLPKCARESGLSGEACGELSIATGTLFLLSPAIAALRAFARVYRISTIRPAECPHFRLGNQRFPRPADRRSAPPN